MKTQLTVAEFATQILDDAAHKADYIADTRTLEWIPDNQSLVIHRNASRDEFLPTEHCHSQIADHIKVPKLYYDRMRRDAPTLFGQTLRTWFDKNPGKRMLRTLRGKARAFVSEKFARNMDDEHFAEIVLPAVQDVEGFEIVSCGRTETNTHLKFKTPRFTRQVKVNDEVQFGMAYRNSEVGCGRLTGSLFVYRLVCLNGMVREEDQFGAAHVQRGTRVDLGDIFQLDTVQADSKAIVLKLRDYTKAILNDKFIDEQVRKMQNVAAIQIGDPIKAVEKLAKDQSFTEATKSSVLQHLVRGGDLSAWGLVNAVTRTAEDQADYDEATWLETLGGRLLDNPRALVAVAA